MLTKYVKGEEEKTNNSQEGPSRPKLQSQIIKVDSPDNEEEVIPATQSLNTIAGGFAGGGETSSARRRYARQVMHVAEPKPNSSNPEPSLNFSVQDLDGIAPHEDDPLVIIIQLLNFNVRRVLIDPGSSADIIYWDAFQGLQLSREHLQPYHATLVGFSGEQVQVKGYITLKTTFGTGPNAKTIKVRYLVIDAPSSYNVILGRPALNTLGAAMSTKYLTLKYPLDNGGVGTVKADQEAARQCYLDSLKTKKKNAEFAPKASSHNINFADLDPREDFSDQRITPTDELIQIQIGDTPDKFTNIGANLTRDEAEAITTFLRKNIDLFAWTPSDMPGIDPTFISHKLSIRPTSKPVCQRKRKLGPERKLAVAEETKKLLEASFIKETQYPSWLSNVVLVKKANGKWRMCVDFTDLNAACPKDPYPLPSIDALIDGASGYRLLSFMDAYSGYNQIKMDPEDADKTAFMTDTCNYYYTVMPFGLKNAGATYQRLMDRVFCSQIGKNLEVYVDDMVVKTAKEGTHVEDLEEIFGSIRQHNMRLNPAKCSFGVQAGKFLGFMLTNRGIEANPDKCRAILEMQSPSSLKEVQQLTGRLAALSRFLSCAGDKAFHFFASIKKQGRFEWTPECQKAFENIKQFLSSPPILVKPTAGESLLLYLAVSEKAISSVLISESNKEQRPVYFCSKVLKGAEIRYQKIEKLALALVTTSRRLRPYFQSHKIIIRTDHPIKQILRKPDLAGRMVTWSVELSEYDIQFLPRGSIKAQVLADFMVEFTPSDASFLPSSWILSVDGASNTKGSGAGITLESPEGLLIEQSLRFEFQTSNNQAEYEALIAGMKLAQEVGVKHLKVKSDSQLITSQVSGEFQTRDVQLGKYLQKVTGLINNFQSFDLSYVPREQNVRADILSKLASSKKPGNNHTVIQETLLTPSIEPPQKPCYRDLFYVDWSLISPGYKTVHCTIQQDDWISPIVQYLQHDITPNDPKEAKKLRREAAKYTLLSDQLYRRGFSTPLLRCLNSDEADYVIREIHKGICGSHIGGRALANKVLRAGYYWPQVAKDCMNFTKACDKCQKHADLIHAPSMDLQSIITPWPFYRWGVDILGPFPKSVGQLKFIIVAVEYFTKWVEAEPVATITAARIKKFYWKNIICRFGIPAEIVSDNGTQFASSLVVDFCKELGIKNKFTSVEHPQANGQTEAANKVILSGIKKKLDDVKTGWVDQLCQVIWSYHTTPHSTTGETPFRLAYGTDAMIPVEIGEPSLRRMNMEEASNSENLRTNLDLLDEAREVAHLREVATKQRAARRYNSKVLPRDIKQGDLVLMKVSVSDGAGKLGANWKGPYRIQAELSPGAYKLETLTGSPVPRSWNSANLRFYYG